ncbi:MAG: SpaA isopeptide-forming pilin-related protein [Acutalibacteraceae bacterium]
MYKSKHNIGKRNGTIRMIALFLTAFMLFCGVLFNYSIINVFADTSSDNNNLKNGSFEDGQTWTSNYKQPNQKDVPFWNTTATDNKIELFMTNQNIYIKNNVTLAPTDGLYAAELNAEEESTLYQNVKTSPSSVYEWGLDHGGRNGTDTMALIIGPRQSVDPSKPDKAGRDQFMQMVDWLIAQKKTSVKDSAGLGEQLTVYSKKFAESGTFKDNAGNNAFSLTPSTIYTEEWHIWIMASSSVKSGTNPWNSYGSNAEDDEGNAGDTGDTSDTGNTGDTGDTELDLSKYYLYTVPPGQTETVFGFVSVGVYQTTAPPGKEKTFGNFIDNINFDLYHPLSGSTTTHGSAVVGGSDGTTGGEGGSEGHQVTIDNKLTTYVVNGEPLKIQAIVKKADVDDGCEFVGMYYTKQDENGNPVTEFLVLAGNETEDTGSLTDEEKKGKWLKSTNTDGDIIYTYYLDGLDSAADLHFVFIKSPTVTYDSNGGKPYGVERKYNTDEAENVYSFKPVTGSDDAQAGTDTLFIDPYLSHAAEGQNDAWKFMGWLLTGDKVDGVSSDIQVNADQLGSLRLPAKHTIACDFTFNGFNGNTKAQYFKIYDGDVDLTRTINKDADDKDLGVIWSDNNETKAYANVHCGITMVAQWRWRQIFIPQVYNTTDNVYEASDQGGTVEIISADPSDENYNNKYDENGGKAYYAEIDEVVTVKATEKEGYKFAGWYDERGKLVSTDTEYRYVEIKESIKTFYARFSDSVTQTYIRQVGSGDSWENTTDDTIGTLGRYSYTDVIGTPISSTATAGSGYKFIGWYDSEGNAVGSDMLTNGGNTISYKTTDDATYFARFQEKVTQNYIRQIKKGDTWEDTTDDKIATLTQYTHTDVVGKDVSSTANEGSFYDFIGWYDSEGNAVGSDMLTNGGKTISYTTTVNATYYARFSKKIVTQTYIRQIKNGDTWENTTDDTIGTLTCYGDEDEIDKSVSSTATAESGYKFVGWYDSEGNKVGSDMLTENGATISYKTTGNATYYAHFEKAYTLSVSKLDGHKTTHENKEPLAGAEFTLYQKDSNGDETIVYNEESIKCTVVESAVTALSESGTEATAVFVDKLSADTEYYLAEIKAPTGFKLLDSPLKITINSSDNSVGIEGIDGIPNEIIGNEVNIELVNYLLPLKLPTTGTSFTGGRFIVAGLLLLASSAIGLFLVKINYERKNSYKKQK